MILRRGSLHRDISIGNILMLDPPVKMEPFSETLEQRMARLHLREETKMVNYVNLVEKMIKELDSPNMYCGLVIDGDVAARLEDYSTLDDLRERSVGMLDCIGEPG